MIMIPSGWWPAGSLPVPPAAAPPAAGGPPPPPRCIFCETKSATGSNCLCVEECGYDECWVIPGMIWKGMPGVVHTFHPVPTFRKDPTGEA